MIFRWFSLQNQNYVTMTPCQILIPDCDLNNRSAFSYWLTQWNDCTLVGFFKSTPVNWHTSPTLFLHSLPEVPLTGEPQEQALGRLSEFHSSLFTVILFFIFLEHMLSHKAAILFLNYSSHHTSACQETVGGHPRSVAAKVSRSIVFSWASQTTTTSNMCSRAASSVAVLVNKYSE